MTTPESKVRIDSKVGCAAAGEFTIGELKRGDESRWDNFVRSTAGGTFYHLAGWRKIFEEQLGCQCHYLLCESGGEIQAVLPLAQVKSWLFGNALISLPFLVYGGPVSASREAAAAVVARACEVAQELGVDHLELRNLEAGETIADGPGWSRSDVHVTFRKEISADSDLNMKSIPRKQRAMIRKGLKAGLRYEIDDDAARLHPVLLECKRNLGTPFFGRRYLDAIKQTFGDNAEILTVLHDQQVVCSVMSFRFGDEILPYYGGGGDLARKYHGNDFMYWCVMERACETGIRQFDFGRSMAGSGAYRFKKHWGFEPEPMGYRNFLIRADSPPNLNAANPKFQLAIKAWKRLPLGLAGMLGPAIARRLG